MPVSAMQTVISFPFCSEFLLHVARYVYFLVYAAVLKHLYLRTPMDVPVHGGIIICIILYTENIPNVGELGQISVRICSVMCSMF